MHATVLYALVALLLSCLVCRADVDRTLRFRKDGTFKVVQFTDLHLGHDAMADMNTIKVRKGSKGVNVHEHHLCSLVVGQRIQQ